MSLDHCKYHHSGPGGGPADGRVGVRRGQHRQRPELRDSLLAEVGRHVCPVCGRVRLQLGPETPGLGQPALPHCRLLEPHHHSGPAGRQRGLPVPAQHGAQAQSGRHPPS